MSGGISEQLKILSANRARRQKQSSDEGQPPRVRRDSFAGPELPVRFTRMSIASNKHSNDPWSMRESSRGSSEALCDAAQASPLTTAEFRQKADKDRSFTGSAPPGVRPPTKRRTTSMPNMINDDDEIGHDAPKRDSGSAPVTRPPVRRSTKPPSGLAVAPAPTRPDRATRPALSP